MPLWIVKDEHGNVNMEETNKLSESKWDEWKRRYFALQQQTRGMINPANAVVTQEGKPADKPWSVYDQPSWAKALEDEHRWDKGANWNLVPKHMREGIKRYVEQGILPGGFMVAVLENELFLAASRADSINSVNLCKIAEFIQTSFPLGSYGSPEIVARWSEHRGLEKRLSE